MLPDYSVLYIMGWPCGRAVLNVPDILTTRHIEKYRNTKYSDTRKQTITQINRPYYALSYEIIKSVLYDAIRYIYVRYKADGIGQRNLAHGTKN